MSSFGVLTLTYMMTTSNKVVLIISFNMNRLEYKLVVRFSLKLVQCVIQLFISG